MPGRVSVRPLSAASVWSVAVATMGRRPRSGSAGRCAGARWQRAAQGQGPLQYQETAESNMQLAVPGSAVALDAQRGAAGAGLSLRALLVQQEAATGAEYLECAP